MPILANTILILAASAQALADPPTTEAGSDSSIQLSNSEFRLPPNSRWRDERITSAPKLSLSVDLGTEKNVRGSMSLLSRQLIEVEAISDKDLRLKFVQADTTSDIDFGNDRSRHTTTLPLDGRTVIAERGERGRWSAKLDGGRRPTGEESAALFALSYLWADSLYPDRKVAIGESWTCEAKDLRNLFGSEFKKPVGEFTFTLARTVEYEGQECVKITGRGKLRSQTKSLGSNAPGAEEKPLAAELDLSIEIYRSLELAIDLSVSMTGTLELSNAGDEDALSYKASSPVEFTRTLKRR